MKKSDILFALVFIVIFLPFFLSKELYEFFRYFSTEWAFTASFVKFALLATLGEMLGLRIRTGKYYTPDFGLLPKALVWGFLGMTVKAAFMIFSGGVPVIAAHLGMENTTSVMAGGISVNKVILAFGISFFLNVFYAPLLMITHRISDIHITLTEGRTGAFFTVPDITRLIGAIDWKVTWGIVIRKTIPLFWIPAQTVTFLLPPEFQILVAALYSTILGVILAVASEGKR